MKKRLAVVYVVLLIQGFVSLCFALGLFFGLPHQFSQAFTYYVALAPVVRNYYCFSLLVSGLMGMLLMTYNIRKLASSQKHLCLLGLNAVCVFFGLLIYPLIDLFYRTNTGMVSDTVELYRLALMSFSIFLTMHFSLGLFVGYCIKVKHPKRKQAAKLGACLSFISIVSCMLFYRNYYQKQEIHLTENLSVRFVGVNGKGSLEVVENVVANQSIYPSFIQSMTYEVSNNGTLQNGEKIAITVLYDQELAKALRLDVVDAVTTMEVSGLREFYSTFEALPSKIYEEAINQSNAYVHEKMAELLADKEAKSELLGQYYIRDDEKGMENPYSLVVLYRISYLHQDKTYYYYRACHVDNVHSDALKNLDVLVPVLSQETYRSTLFESDEQGMSVEEAKAHLNASLLNRFDYVEEVQLDNH